MCMLLLTIAFTAMKSPTMGRQLLYTFANRRISETAKEAALQELMQSQEREAQLDSALDAIDSTSKARALFAGRLWPVPLPSRRAALGSYGRLLSSMDSETTGSSGVQEDDRPRRRRFLLVLLRQLRSRRGVWALEREARRRDAQATSMSEMLKRTPAELETPTYEVLAERGAWEVRRYEEFAVCTTRRRRAVESDGVALAPQSRGMSGAGAFQSLAGYIFGKNGAGEKMAMTTPVLVGAGGAPDEGEVMSFVLPSRYWKAEVSPPAPLDDAVVLERRGGGVLETSDTLACLWFGGFAGGKTVEAKKVALLEAVRADAEWELLDEARALLLQYNDPFTPPWARRSEVAVPIRRKA
jgi:hypothetical protein